MSSLNTSYTLFMGLALFYDLSWKKFEWKLLHFSTKPEFQALLLHQINTSFYDPHDFHPSAYLLLCIKKQINVFSGVFWNIHRYTLPHAGSRTSGFCSFIALFKGRNKKKKCGGGGGGNPRLFRTFSTSALLV